MKLKNPQWNGPQGDFAFPALLKSKKQNNGDGLGWFVHNKHWFFTKEEAESFFKDWEVYMKWPAEDLGNGCYYIPTDEEIEHDYENK